MFRPTDIVMIAAMVAAAAFTYTTKHGAEAELSKVRKLEADIRFEEETSDILRADWSLLTQPSRLQRLSEAYNSELKLAPLEAHQIATIDQLPPRPVRIEDILSDDADALAALGIDGTVTSGVQP